MPFGADHMQTTGFPNTGFLLLHRRRIPPSPGRSLAGPEFERLGGAFSGRSNALLQLDHGESAVTPGLHEITGQLPESLISVVGEEQGRGSPLRGSEGTAESATRLQHCAVGTGGLYVQVTKRPSSTSRNFKRAMYSLLPPRMMSVPRPAMLVAMVTHQRPAWATISDSRSTFSGLALSRLWISPPTANSTARLHGSCAHQHRRPFL